jgi:hypothetical protein
MNTEVANLLIALREGSMTIDQVAQRFRQRVWPQTRGPEPQTYLELASAAEQDPEPDVPGSFEEVAAAYRRGELSRTDYRILAKAAADTFRADDQHRAGEASGAADD